MRKDFVEYLGKDEYKSLYEFKGLLGSGAYGRVLKGLDKKQNQDVAIKEITPRDKNEFVEFQKEVDLCNKVR